MAARGYKTYRAGTALVIGAPDEIDIANQQQLEDVAVRGLARGPVVVDLTATTFLAISTLRVLVRCQRASEQSGCPFVLAAVCTSVLDLLVLAQLSDQLRIYPSVDAAQRALQGGLELFADKLPRHP